MLSGVDGVWVIIANFTLLKSEERDSMILMKIYFYCDLLLH